MSEVQNVGRKILILKKSLTFQLFCLPHCDSPGVGTSVLRKEKTYQLCWNSSGFRDI